MNTILALLICVPVVYSSFSPFFNEWLNKTYGEEMANRLNRKDLGEQGSFGGGNYPNIYKHNRRPVLLVHGATDWAGYYGNTRKQFLKLGYLDGEVYGTTYGEGEATFLPFERLKCGYVQHVRDMLIAVNNYTGSKVDIVAYSLGSPVARKAILGGKCVDTEDELGNPLKDLVHTFLSVAGANYGSFYCWLLQLGICNSNNGLSCTSKFLKDINSRQHYEGELVLVMYSTGDDMVGYKGCGDKILSSINGSDYTVEKEGLSHREVIEGTLEEQYKLIKEGIPLSAESN